MEHSLNNPQNHSRETVATSYESTVRTTHDNSPIRNQDMHLEFCSSIQTRNEDDIVFTDDSRHAEATENTIHQANITCEQSFDDNTNINDNRLEDQQGKNSTSTDDMKQTKVAENSSYQICMAQKADPGEKNNVNEDDLQHEEDSTLVENPKQNASDKITWERFCQTLEPIINLTEELITLCELRVEDDTKPEKFKRCYLDIQTSYTNADGVDKAPLKFYTALTTQLNTIRLSLKIYKFPQEIIDAFYIAAKPYLAIERKYKDALEADVIRYKDTFQAIEHITTFVLRYQKEFSQIFEKYREERKKTEDFLVKCDVDKLAEHFLVKVGVIFYDRDIESETRKDYLNTLKETHNVQAFTILQEALDYIHTAQAPFYLLTTVEHGEPLIQQTSANHNLLKAYVLCDDVIKRWIEKPKKVVYKESKFIGPFGKNYRYDFPAFGPIFSSADTTNMNKLYYYLHGFLLFENREQAKSDFLSLVHKVYDDIKNIDDFEEHYRQYDKESILNWYTRNSFFNKALNNCLRIATADSILYSRLIIKDLQTAIRCWFHERPKKFSGLLYRGCCFSKEEWTNLQANTGKEVQMYGFLSTSKEEKIAHSFLKKKYENATMVTIIVPDAPYLGEEGFAEMREVLKF